MLSQRPPLNRLIDLAAQYGVSSRFLRYLLIGGIGFLVDAGGLEAFIHSGFSVYSARLCSMAIAIASTYFLHRNFTFSESERPQRSFYQFTLFLACQIAAAAVNYSVFCLFLALLPQPVFFISRMLSLMAGVGAGLLINYAALQKVVFPNKASPLRPWRLFPLIITMAWSLRLALLRQNEVLKWPAVGHDLGPADSDVWLRLNQVRQWLGGGDFFDHLVYNTNAPYGGIAIHWTRPLDALLAFFFKIMPPQLPDDTRLLMASAWLPAVLGVVAFAVLSTGLLRRFRHVGVLWSLLLLVAFSPWQQYFPPGESDHHGLLSLLWCVVIALLVRPLSPRTAILTGSLLGFMFWINTEALLLIGIVYLLLGIRALRSAEEMRCFSLVTTAAAVISLIGLTIEVPPSRFFSFEAYDTLSIVYVSLLSFVAAGCLILTLPRVQRLGALYRLCAAAVVATVVIMTEIIIYPKILLGPLADADPFITKVFFKKVTEARSIYRQPVAIIIQHIWQPLFALLLMAMAWPKVKSLRREQIVTCVALMLGTFGMIMLQGRWTYYLQPVALLSAASFLPGLVRLKFTGKWLSVEKPLRPAIVIFASYIASIVLGSFFAFDNTNSNVWQCQSQMRYVIQSRQLQPLLGTEAFTLYAPPEVGGDILFFTPYRIIAGEYHREGKGLHDIAQIAEEKNDEFGRRRLKLRKADAMLVCPMSEDTKSWLHNLSETNHPDWLTPVTGVKFMDKPGPKPQLFVIN